VHNPLLKLAGTDIRAPKQTPVLEAAE